MNFLVINTCPLSAGVIKADNERSISTLELVQLVVFVCSFFIYWAYYFISCVHVSVDDCENMKWWHGLVSHQLVHLHFFKISFVDYLFVALPAAAAFSLSQLLLTVTASLFSTVSELQLPVCICLSVHYAFLVLCCALPTHLFQLLGGLSTRSPGHMNFQQTIDFSQPHATCLM